MDQFQSFSISSQTNVYNLKIWMFSTVMIPKFSVTILESLYVFKYFEKNNSLKQLDQPSAVTRNPQKIHMI